MTRVERIAKRDGWCCHYCVPVIPGVPVRPLTAKSATADHIIPVSQGGLNALGNLVLACEFHNRYRGTMDYRQFRERCNLPPCPEVWDRADALPRKWLVLARCAPAGVW